MKGRVVGYTWEKGESDARTILIAVPGYTDESGVHPQLHQEVEVRPEGDDDGERITGLLEQVRVLESGEAIKALRGKLRRAAQNESDAHSRGLAQGRADRARVRDNEEGLREVLEFYGIERRADGAWVATEAHKDTYRAERRVRYERGKEAGRSELAATMERILQHGRAPAKQLNIILREVRLGEIEVSVKFASGELVICAPQTDVVAALEALDMALRGRPEPAPDELTLDDEEEDSLAAKWLRETFDANPGMRVNLSLALEDVLRERFPEDWERLQNAKAKLSVRRRYHTGVDKVGAEGSRCMVTILENREDGQRRLVYSGEVDVDEHGGWHFTDAKNEEAGK